MTLLRKQRKGTSVMVVLLRKQRKGSSFIMVLFRKQRTCFIFIVALFVKLRTGISFIHVFVRKLTHRQRNAWIIRLYCSIVYGYFRQASPFMNKAMSKFLQAMDKISLDFWVSDPSYCPARSYVGYQCQWRTEEQLLSVNDSPIGKGVVSRYLMENK